MSRLTLVFVTVCFVLAMIYQDVNGQCRGDELKVEKQYGKNVFYCEYEGHQYFEGSEWSSKTNCEKCTCSNSGLRCCSIGGSSVTFSKEGKCTWVRIACQVKWVKISNEKRKCPKNKMPLAFTIIGK